MKEAKGGTVIWLPGFGAAIDPVNGAKIVTNPAGSCTFQTPGGPLTDNTMVVSAKLAGRASCNTASTDTTQYPLNGKLAISNVAKTLKEQIYTRVAGFDTSAGPDVISITGIDVKGQMPGATMSGEVTFDPVVKALANFTPPAPLPPVSVLKNQYYFDNAQVAAPCGGPGGTGVSLIYGTDGTSLLGSSGQALSLDI
jgi:hypothetical protein